MFFGQPQKVGVQTVFTFFLSFFSDAEHDDEGLWGLTEAHQIQREPTDAGPVREVE